MAQIDATFPVKFQPLFKPARYKVYYGGRGGAKSWAFARALLIKGLERPTRILCAREIQKSIKQSVHQLLGDQIQALGMSGAYSVLENEIRGFNGTQFMFAGLQDHTVDSIKSYEGVDIVWVEEGQSVSARSWNVLIPTIRKPGSEIWVSFNPYLDSDPTYVRFVLNPPPGAVICKVNYSDNPWFPKELELERQHAKATADPDDYANIWEGECKAAVEGAIYAREIAKLQEERRFGIYPTDPLLKSHVVCDLGWNDAMAIGVWQRQGSGVVCTHYIEDSHRTLDSYSSELRAMGLNWGQMYLPHDGRHKDVKYGRSAEEIMRSLGWDVRIVPDASIEQGIKVARMVFPRVYMNSTGTERLLECLRRYRRAIPKTTNEPAAPLHDAYSHGSDMFRYACLVADQLKNDAWGGGKIKYSNAGIV